MLKRGQNVDHLLNMGQNRRRNIEYDDSNTTII